MNRRRFLSLAALPVAAVVPLPVKRVNPAVAAYFGAKVGAAIGASALTGSIAGSAIGAVIPNVLGTRRG